MNERQRGEGPTVDRLLPAEVRLRTRMKSPPSSVSYVVSSVDDFETGIAESSFVWAGQWILAYWIPLRSIFLSFHSIYLLLLIRWFLRGTFFNFEI